MKAFAQIDSNAVCVCILEAELAPSDEHIERPTYDESEIGKVWNGHSFEEPSE